MRLIRPSSDDEMVAAFLRAEIDSDVWAPHIKSICERQGWPESLVRTPNLSDPEANRRRAEVLRQYRGWQGSEFILSGLPYDVVWHWAELELAEVGEVLGACFPAWRALSGGSRRVADAASAAVAGLFANDGAASLARRASVVAQRYREGQRLQPPILVAPTSGSPIVAVEGHARLIAWAIAEAHGPLGVILGLSDQISEWGWY